MKASKENLRKKITFMLVFLMGVFASGTVLAAPDATMIISNPGENAANEMRIGWHTATSVTSNSVEYTKKSDTSWANSKTVNGTYKLCTTWNNGIPAGQNIQVNRYGAVLSGLDPNTEYMYRVGSVERETRYFKTAGAKEYHFAWISDAHVYNPLPARLTYSMNMVSQLIKAAGTEGVNFIFSTGDDTAHGGTYAYWKTLCDHAHYKNYMWVSMIGNHDYMTSDANSANYSYNFFRDSHNYPLNGYAGQEGCSYWFKYGDILWIILNNEDLNKSGQVPKAQAWLEQVIQQNPSQYIFVAEHYQYFNGVSGATNAGFNNWNQLFDKYGVDLALAGNNHIYLRTKPIYNGAASTDPEKGTVYLQSPSSDNDRGQAMNETLSSNSDKIVFRWTQGTYTVGGILMSVSESKIRVRLYDRDGKLLDDADIPTKRKAVQEFPKVIGVAPTNLTAISVNNPIELTFNNKMDKASVQNAISFSPAATVDYTWTNNDYTLSIDISKLSYSTNYSLTINGSTAKNPEGKFLDGAGNGTEKSNYVLNFSTGQQETPPVVVSYDPQEDQEEALRPIVRIEFNKLLSASSILSNQITVTNNSTGQAIAGTQRYNEVNGRGILHYFFTNDLTPGTIYKVVMKEGLKDVAGNVMATDLTYTFQARPREIIQTQAIESFPASSIGGSSAADRWWNPGETASTTGIDTKVTLTSSSDEIAYSTNTTSMRMDYLFTTDDGVIRLHRRGDPRFTKYPNTSIQFYLFGDASKSKFRISARAGAADGGGTLWSCIPFEINWAGWKLITWDLYDDSKGEVWLAGDNPITDGTQIDVKDFGLHPASPRSNIPSFLLIDEIVAVELGSYYPGVGIAKIIAENGISVASQTGFINISAGAAINEVKIYSISGALVKSLQPGQVSYQIPTNDLMQGVYIVKIVTGTSQKNVKAFVQ